MLPPLFFLHNQIKKVFGNVSQQLFPIQMCNFTAGTIMVSYICRIPAHKVPNKLSKWIITFLLQGLIYEFQLLLSLLMLHPNHLFQYNTSL